MSYQAESNTLSNILKGSHGFLAIVPFRFGRQEALFASEITTLPLRVAALRTARDSDAAKNLIDFR
jgi:hypothetical protein